VSKWEPGVSEADTIEHRIATARADGRREAFEEAMKALRGLDIHHHHVGYDDGPGGGNYVYADVVILEEAEDAIRAMMEKE